MYSLELHMKTVTKRFDFFQVKLMEYCMSITWEIMKTDKDHASQWTGGAHPPAVPAIRRI